MSGELPARPSQSDSIFKDFLGTIQWGENLWIKDDVLNAYLADIQETVVEAINILLDHAESNTYIFVPLDFRGSFKEEEVKWLESWVKRELVKYWKSYILRRCEDTKRKIIKAITNFWDVEFGEKSLGKGVFIMINE